MNIAFDSRYFEIHRREVAFREFLRIILYPMQIHSDWIHYLFLSLFRWVWIFLTENWQRMCYSWSRLRSRKLTKKTSWVHSKTVYAVLVAFTLFATSVNKVERSQYFDMRKWIQFNNLWLWWLFVCLRCHFGVQKWNKSVTQSNIKWCFVTKCVC